QGFGNAGIKALLAQSGQQELIGVLFGCARAEIGKSRITKRRQNLGQVLVVRFDRDKRVCDGQSCWREPVHGGGATNEVRGQSPFSMLQVIQIRLGHAETRGCPALGPAFCKPSGAEFVRSHELFYNRLVISCQGPHYVSFRIIPTTRPTTSASTRLRNSTDFPRCTGL